MEESSAEAKKAGPAARLPGRWMPIRLKLMAVLVMTAGIPLLMLALADYVQMRSLGQRLTLRSQMILESRAKEQLMLMIETASEMAKRERVAVNYALLYQQSLSEEFTVDGKLPGPRERSRLEQGFAALDERSPDLIYRQFTVWKNRDLVARPPADANWQGKDLLSTSWYRKAMSDGGHIFNAQPSDETNGKVLIMLALPVRDRNDRAVAVTAIEILPQKVIDMSHLPDNWGRDTKLFLINADKAKGEKVEVIAIQEGAWSQPAAMQDLQSDDPAAFQAMLDEIRKGGTGVVEMPYQGKRSFWAFGATGKMGAAVLFILPHEVVIREAQQVQDLVYEEVHRQLLVSAILAVIIVFAVVVLTWFGSHHLTNPLRRLLEAAGAIGRGDFSARVDIRTRDELELLGDTFNHMVPALEDHVKIKETLAVANDVQAHLLPKEPLLMPRLEVSGKAIYCDEIGGDYFDYFEITHNERPVTVVAIGDVTGHGVPSALLMATARALLHSHVERRAEQDTLKDVLQHLNNQLARDSAGGRFMTLFCMVISPETGNMAWASAGHDPALIYRAADGRVEELDGAGLALGIMPGRAYENHRGEFYPGDVILMGTDGVWEAKNPDGEMFGKERLRALLSTHGASEVLEIQKAILSAVQNFQAGAVQADDITVVVAKKIA